MPRELAKIRYAANPAPSSNNPISPQGFTVIEQLVTIAIILTIAAIAIPRFLAAIEKAKIARAVGDIHTIGTGVMGYQIVKGQCPNALADVGYGEILDPWGQPYKYLDFANVMGKGPMRKDRFLVPINTYFDLYSIGKDGQRGVVKYALVIRRISCGNVALTLTSPPRAVSALHSCQGPCTKLTVFKIIALVIQIPISKGADESFWPFVRKV